MQPIADARLELVMGGNMQWDPNLLATIEQTGRRKPAPKQSAEMLQAVTGLRDALSGASSAGQQAQQQGQQQMMQMMQQMMGR